MTLTDTEALLNSVIDSLEDISSATETVYSTIGDCYPRLVHELDSGYDFTNSSSQAGSARLALSRTIGDILQLIDDNDLAFQKTEHDNQAMLTLLEAQLTALEQLGGCVREIREDSLLMELISLNAMVIAVKAGESGRAFSCITTELKTLSGQTISLTEQIEQSEAAIFGIFSDFKTSLKDMNLREKTLFQRFIGESKAVFAQIGDATHHLLQGLEAIHQRTSEVKEPLVKIMVDVQRQDQIRQSIDHVILSVREIGHPAQDRSMADHLDHLSFLAVLPDLSRLVLEDVADRLKASRTAFQQALVQARQRVDVLENDRQAFLRQQWATNQADNLEALFRNSQSLFAGFMSETKALIRVKDTSHRKSASLEKYVADLVDNLQSFEAILSRFQNIDVASRIQVARHSALASMKDNASEMSKLTQKIKLDVDQSTGITSQFFSTVKTLFLSYRDQFGRRIQLDTDFQNRLAAHTHQLETARQALLQTVQGTQVFTQGFFHQFSETEASLQTLDRLLAKIADQILSLDQLRDVMAEERRKALHDYGLTEWTMNNEKLKSMVNRFTIFTHKEFAANLGNFEVEQAVESGELTLF